MTRHFALIPQLVLNNWSPPAIWPTKFDAAVSCLSEQPSCSIWKWFFLLLPVWLSIGELRPPELRGHTAECEPAQEPDAKEGNQENEPAKKSARLIRVPLPIDHAASQIITATLQRAIEAAPVTTRPEDRPVIILKFDTDRGINGAGSSLSDCLELAQLLTSPEANRVKVVAYLPPVLDRLRNPAQPGPACQLFGHAVLVAIACEDIVIAAGGELGQAVDIQARPDPLTIDIYRNIAEARLTLPTSLVLSMVDSSRSLYAVATDKGDLLVDRKELEELEKAGRAIQSETLNTPGQVAKFQASQLDRFSTNLQAVADLQQLAVRYGINPAELDFNNDTQKKWKAVQFNLPEYVDRRSADFGVRAIEDALAKDPELNLVVIVNGSRGGDIDACLKLATYLSDFDRDKIRTATFIPQQSSGAAALIALSTDHLLLPAEARLGGEFKPPVAPDELNQLQPELERIAKTRDRDAALFLACLDPAHPIGRWRHGITGQVRLLTDAQQSQLADADQWTMLEQGDFSAGFTGTDLEQDGIARALLASENELITFYQLENSPRPLAPTKVDQILDRFARFLASPFVAAWLLFGAMFLLSTEMSTPGVGFPGLLGTLCLVLFFWSQNLGGNADWLEILLFLAGVGFILMELFLFPGTMILGIGGLLMVVVSIVLATQTFFIPRNSRELAQLPVSLGLVCAAFSGVLVALLLLRRYLPNAPFFKRLMLEPPVSKTPFDEERPPEEFDVLVGQRGVAISRLVPSGKARIGNKYVDVITDGIIVDPKTRIEVVEVTGNRVLVKPVE